MFDNMQVQPRRSIRTSYNYGATGGENQRDWPSRIKQNQAQSIRNYFIEGDGRMVTREGLTTTETFTGLGSNIKAVDNDIIAYAYDDGSNSKLATYTISTDTSSIKKTFSTRGDVAMVIFGDLIIGSDGTEGIGFCHKNGKFLQYTQYYTLAFDNQTANFNVGAQLSGATSHATGTIVSVVDNGATGVITFSNLSGTFQDNETITDDGGVPGSAKANGTDSQSYWNIGATVTGGTSGATGIVFMDKNGGTSGYLLVIGISGTFQNGEKISDNGSSPGGGAISLAPYDWHNLTSVAAGILELYNYEDGTKLIAGRATQETGSYVDQELIRISETALDPTTFPFTNWTVPAAPAPTDPNRFMYKGGGTLNDIIAHDDKLFCLFDNATCVIAIQTINVDLVGLAQTTVVLQQARNYGGFKGVSTPKGVIFTNENGINLFDLTQDDVAFELSTVIGEDRVNDITFDNSTIFFDGRKRVYINCGESSATNNLTLVYDIVVGAWTEVTGWSLGEVTRLVSENNKDLWGLSSVAGKIYRLLDGYTDDGLPISGRILFAQDNGGNPNQVKDMENLWVQGKFSAASVILCKIHTWNKKNQIQESAFSEYMFGEMAVDGVYGYGKTGFGKVQNEDSDLISENYFHKGRTPVKNFLKYQVELVSSYASPHEIHYYAIDINHKHETRLNNFTKIKPTTFS